MLADLVYEILREREGKPAPVEQRGFDPKTDKCVEDWLKGHVRETRRLEVPTPSTWFRASSLAQMCGRQVILAGYHKVALSEELNVDDMLTYALGDGFHHFMQNDVFGPRLVLYGIWRCVSCNKLYGTSDQPVLRPEVCECKSETLVYKEMEVKNVEYLIWGHPDGILDLGRGKRVLELKTIHEYGFKKEVDIAPYTDHVVQTNLYMWLTGVRKATVIYHNKAGYGVRSLKVYELDYDAKLVQGILSKVTTARRGLRMGILPPRLTTCANRETTTAKNCGLRDPCFACGNRVDDLLEVI